MMMTIDSALKTYRQKLTLADNPPPFVDCANDNVRRWIIGVMDGDCERDIIDWLVANVPASLMHEALELMEVPA